MDILQYLIALLKIRKEIGIEGLGTLDKKKIPGRYDANTHSFLPPSHVLQFTTDVTETTNLAQYIQNQRGISEESAKYFISQFVATLKKDLQHKGEVTLSGVGSFKAENEKITFVPTPDVNIGFDFFALPAVTANQTINPDRSLAYDASAKPADTLIPQIAQIEDKETDLAGYKEDNETVTTEEETTVEGTETVENSIQAEAIDIDKEEQTSTTEGTDRESSFESDSENFEHQVAETSNESNLPEKEVIEESILEANDDIDADYPEANDTDLNKVDDADTWNFDEENVVSDAEIKEEEFSANEYKGSESIPNNAPTPITEMPITGKSEDVIKLNATTKNWDFEHVTGKDDEPLIGALDNDEQEEQEKRSGMPLFQKSIIGLLLLLLIAAAVYYFNPEIFGNFSRNNTKPHEKMTVPIQNNLKTQQDSLSFADSIMRAAEQVGLEVEPTKDTLRVTATKTEVKPAITYDIIIASFATSAKANDYVDKMKKRGFDAKISTMPGRRKNISIATYNHPDSAEKYVTKFRKQFKNQDIYAQPIKNK